MREASVEVTIRYYRSDDRDAVLEITERSFPGFCLDENVEKLFGDIAGTSWQSRKKKAIAYDLDYRPADTLVAEVGGQVVGYACNRIYRTRSVGHVANMAVDPEYQGCGVGKALLKASLDHFRRRGMECARIETLEQNYKARKLYPSFGFKEVGSRIYYFREL